MPLAAYYLTRLLRGTDDLDAVARFRLGNGAVPERLNWLGDSSPQGIERSYGIMVNCVYRLTEVERNHELFINQHRVLASRGIEGLAAAGAALIGTPR